MTEILCQWPHRGGTKPDAEFKVIFPGDFVVDVGGSMDALPTTERLLCGECKDLIVAQNKEEHLIVESVGTVYRS